VKALRKMYAELVLLPRNRMRDKTYLHTLKLPELRTHSCFAVLADFCEKPCCRLPIGWLALT